MSYHVKIEFEDQLTKAKAYLCPEGVEFKDDESEMPIYLPIETIQAIVKMHGKLFKD